MIFSKQAFREHVSLIFSKSTLTTTQLESLYDAASTGKKTGIEESILEKLIENVFMVPYSKTTMIPWEFLKTPVGEVMCKLIYEINSDDFIFPNELAELTGYTTQHIIQEIKRGNIEAHQRTHGSVWLIREASANQYLARRGKLTVRELRNKAEEKRR